MQTNYISPADGTQQRSNIATADRSFRLTDLTECYNLIVNTAHAAASVVERTLLTACLFVVLELG